MSKIKTAFFPSLLLPLAAAAWAQMEEVIVTGSQISGDDYSSIPAITLEKRVDFLALHPLRRSIDRISMSPVNC